MNIVNKITLRQLKQNKRRTLVTIIGVIISVAMVTAVAVLATSFQDFMKQVTIASDGEWHVEYANTPANQLPTIQEDEQTDELVVTNDLGYAEFDGAERESKPYLFFKEMNEAGFDLFPVQLTEGRLPQSSGEVLINENILADTKTDLGIGTTFTVDIGQRVALNSEQPLGQETSIQYEDKKALEKLKPKQTKTFTVVGTMESTIWERSWSPGYTILHYLDPSTLNEGDKVNSIAKVNNVNSSIYDNAEHLAEQTGAEEIHYHDSLLRYYGVTDHSNLKKTFFSLIVILMLIIMIGSISLIYNAFAISVSERSKHLGMLSSIGATKRQKRNSVFFEGGVIGAISIPIGILSGIAGIAATFMFINPIIQEVANVDQKLSVVVTPISLVSAVVVSAVTILISSYLPARKASKLTAMDAIRQTQDVKLTGKAVKTSKLVRKMFGMEAEIGLKNLKRNKKRYKATVFSLVISIILFLTVSFFTDNIKKSLELTQADINYDIKLSGFEDVSADDIKPYTQLEGVTASTFIRTIYLSASVEEKKVPEVVKDYKQRPLDNGKYSYSVNLYAMDDESFRKYAGEIGKKTDDMIEADQPSAILVNEITYNDQSSGRVIETEGILTNVNETLTLHSIRGETEQKGLGEIEIAALTDQLPMGITSTSRPGGVDLITSEQMLETFLSNQKPEHARNTLYLNSSDPMKTQEAIEEIKPSHIRAYNVEQSRQQQERMLLFMSVFTYGFIALISAISIANIFNTISTSIAIRKREFAMLKSVGMTPKGFNKMINYESIFYGFKALIYGLPISIACMGAIYVSLRHTFTYGFALPWISILYVIIAIFIIVGSTMLYSIRKIKKQNIIEGLRQENL
ncbi:lipoprotein release ABC transporter permease [Gracilibacillus halophilus YIM-C55.5]|uniref:Lipoprotein release ABC transporter permease n=1 Tax=Gracilibacillus halophilus YIM-C55.5 TaxID=1308866 RepID=N4WVX7_9BACI|nr:ABC transporter permease [Gracilibacillus halophilus]ENH97246.1 lipoprotein release ABC transporter permease [Gracilibacillus halophilus YIM-C55.5]